jgi:hypothetical protein
MDEGLPIAYAVVEKGIPVYASDQVQVGTVHHVVAARQQDIFHGIVMNTDHGKRFVEAADVASLHERGADLRIDAAAAASLPEPAGGAPSYHEDPAEVTKWHHWWRHATLRKDWDRDE